MRIVFAFVLLVSVSCSSSKKIEKQINDKDVTRIEATLSHDSMEGRKLFTPGIEKAAAFIASEMKQTGLAVPDNAAGYLQRFEMITTATTQAAVYLGADTIAAQNIICVSPEEKISFTNNSGYQLVRISKGDTFRTKIRSVINKKANTLVLIDNSFSTNFKNLKQLKGPAFAGSSNQVFVLTGNTTATDYRVEIAQTATVSQLANVVGLLKGKSKPDEYVIFSGHYDHLGYGKADDKGDSLYNGANDDASGVTAMLMLARYYKALKNNERSLLFVAFTAEESGGFGSTYFSNQIKPEQVAAMFNIEMIGTDSKWGLNSAYLTGYEKSDMGKILEQNLVGSKFKFYPDPYTQQQLFYRSDNATLARKGVPAHTISTSKMDNEPHYHKPSDEIKTLDMQNMTEVIRSIALSAKTIVNGTDTPTRVDTNSLQ